MVSYQSVTVTEDKEGTLGIFHRLHKTKDHRNQSQCGILKWFLEQKKARAGRGRRERMVRGQDGESVRGRTNET